VVNSAAVLIDTLRRLVDRSVLQVVNNTYTEANKEVASLKNISVRTVDHRGESC